MGQGLLARRQLGVGVRRLLSMRVWGIAIVPALATSPALAQGKIGFVSLDRVLRNAAPGGPGAEEHRSRIFQA